MIDVPLAGGMAAAPVGVAVLSDQLVFLSVNETLCVINGRTEAEHVGRTITGAFGARAAVWEGHARAALDGARPVGPVRVAAPPERGARSFEATFMPADGGRAGRVVVALVQEVTELVEATQRFEIVGVVTMELATARTLDDIATAVTSGLARGYVEQVAFVAIEHHLARTVAVAGRVGAAGASSPGHEIPLEDDPAIAECVRTGRPVIIGDHATTIIAPVLVDDRVVAAIRVIVTGPPRRQLIASDLSTTVASLSGLAMKRLQTTEQVELHRFRNALNAMLDEVTICSSIRDDRGEIIDFRLDFVKDGFADRSGRGAADLVGRRVLDCYPNWGPSGVFERFVDVVETGVPLLDERLEYEDVRADGSAYRGTWQVQVVRLGDGFLSTSRDITAQLQADEELAEARLKLITERESVRLLQQLSLPTELPVVDGVTVAAHYRPADVDTPLGGDWYDATTTTDGRLVVIIGDVAGHGRAAASTMIRLRNVTNAFAQTMRSPADVLTATSSTLREDLSLMATCLVVTYHPETATLVASSAGHLPPIIRSARGAEVWRLDPGLPLGVGGSSSYVEQARHLDGPRVLVMYTDGLIERRNEDLGAAIEALVRRVEGSPDPYRPDRLCHDLVESVAGDELEDDYCVLAVGIDPAGASIPPGVGESPSAVPTAEDAADS